MQSPEPVPHRHGDEWCEDDIESRDEGRFCGAGETQAIGLEPEEGGQDEAQHEAVQQLPSGGDHPFGQQYCTQSQGAEQEAQAEQGVD